MIDDTFVVRDGLEELEQELPFMVDLIVRTARWVHPDTFRALPVWYPEAARGLPSYDVKWEKVYTNKSRSTAVVANKSEANILAARGFVAALGVKKQDNWTVCHIWSVENPKFQRTNTVVRDRKYYSCVGNMIWLPTPLKAFTDAVPSIRRMLPICAFHLYGWACQHDDVVKQAAEVRFGEPPSGYPEEWPAPGREGQHPPGTAPFSPRVAAAIVKRKEELRRMLNDASLVNFPRDDVREALEFWKVDLSTEPR